MIFSVTSVVLLVVLIAAIALIYDSLKKSKKDVTAELDTENKLTADQMEPTLTGKFRVQQMLDIAQQTSPKQHQSPRTATAAKEGVVAHDEDEDVEALPDPFKNKKK